MPPATGVESTSTIYANIRKSLDKIDQVSKEGEKYIDLYLVHAPRSGPEARKNNWEALVKAQKEGWVKDIGVSNLYVHETLSIIVDEMGLEADMYYSGVRHLKKLPSPTPTINQIELHPWCQQRDIVDYCKSHNIIVQAYCPLVKAKPEYFNNKVIVGVAKKHQKDSAQVLVRWSLQKGSVSIRSKVSMVDWLTSIQLFASAQVYITGSYRFECGPIRF